MSEFTSGLVPENIVREAKDIVEAHMPTSPELADFRPLAFKKIDPEDFEGVDLRTLSEEQIKAILDQYPSLRDTENGCHLGQNAAALTAARRSKRDMNEFLEEDRRWIFKIKPKEN